VDPVTHTLVGVTLGNGLFRRRAGAGAVPILALASNLPDLDAVVHLTGDPTAVMMRRTFGHSLLLLPLWCLALAFIVRRLWRHLTLLEAFGMVAVGAGLHLFFDLINSFGVVLLWPLSPARPELAWVFIIDFILTALLAAPLLAAIAPRLRPRLGTMSRAALAAVGLYLAVCGAAHHRAVTLLAEAADAQSDQAASGGTGGGGGEAGASDTGEGNAGDDASGLGPDWVDVGPAEPPDFQYVFPEALGPHRWRGVTRTRDHYRIYLINVVTGSVTLRREVITRTADPRVARARATPLGRRIGAFFKAPVWVIDSNTGVVRVYDLRFLSLVLGREAVFRFTVPVH
jgi:membrane-bound metal-dependent hydrolase YbcI (DUF457 family)